jgi:hypothetical protein
MDECPKMSKDRRNLAVSWCVDGVQPFGQDKSDLCFVLVGNRFGSTRSMDLSVVRIESLPGEERSQFGNMMLLQIVTDRHLTVVRSMRK